MEHWAHFLLLISLIVNPGARLPISSLEFFLNVSADLPRSIVRRNNLMKDIPLQQNSEFYQWVDAIFNELQS